MADPIQGNKSVRRSESWHKNLWSLFFVFGDQNPFSLLRIQIRLSLGVARQFALTSARRKYSTLSFRKLGGRKCPVGVASGINRRDVLHAISGWHLAIDRQYSSVRSRVVTQFSTWYIETCKADLIMTSIATINREMIDQSSYIKIRDTLVQPITIKKMGV